MLKSLIVVIALMFTTTAFAQEQCKSTGEINRFLVSLLDHVELVPPDETDYIRKEYDAASIPLIQQRDLKRSLSEDRLKRLEARRLYPAFLLRDNTARAKQSVEAAERATTAKDRAMLLIEVLTRMRVLDHTVGWFNQADDKRQQPTQQPTMSQYDKLIMGASVFEATDLTTDILRCVVKGL